MHQAFLNWSLQTRPEFKLVVSKTRPMTPWSAPHKRQDVFEDFQLRRPGAYHHARFLGKSLYQLKVFLLSNAFHLSQQDSDKLWQLVGFVDHKRETISFPFWKAWTAWLRSCSTTPYPSETSALSLHFRAIMPHISFAQPANGSVEWLEHHPCTWAQYSSHQYLDDFIWDVQAEEAVKDVQDCAWMTRDPAHRDVIILVANDHRGIVACLRKDNLNHVWVSV